MLRLQRVQGQLQLLPHPHPWSPALCTASPCISPVKGLFCELYPNPGLGHSSWALTSRLLSAGGCLSQQYEMTCGDRSALSLLPYTLLFHQTKSANPSVSSSVMILKSIFCDIS